MTMPISEDERVELWKLEQFVRMEFDGDAVSALLFWDADPHEAHRLLFRDGARTECTHEQALRILRPLHLPAVSTQEHVEAFASIGV